MVGRGGFGEGIGRWRGRCWGEVLGRGLLVGGYWMRVGLTSLSPSNQIMEWDL